MQFAKPISGVGSGAGGCDSLRSAELEPNKYCMCREGFSLGRAPGPCCALCQTPPPSLIYLRGPGLGSPDSLGSSHPTGSIAAQRRPQLRPRQDPQLTPTAAARVRRRAGHEHRPGDRPKLKLLRESTEGSCNQCLHNALPWVPSGDVLGAGTCARGRQPQRRAAGSWPGAGGCWCQSHGTEPPRAPAGVWQLRSSYPLRSQKVSSFFCRV